MAVAAVGRKQRQGRGSSMGSGGCVRLKGIASGGWVAAGEGVKVRVWATAVGGKQR